MALRLARFNARIDVEDQPHKSAGFLTGVPAPAGAGLLLLPIFLWLASDRQWTWLQDYRLVAPWAAFIAFLVISSVATFSWGSLRLRRNVRLEAIVRHRPSGRRAGLGAVGDAERRRARLSGADPVQHAELCEGQAAARAQRRRRCRSPSRCRRSRRDAPQGGDDRRPMRLQSDFENRRPSATSRPKKKMIERE